MANELHDQAVAQIYSALESSNLREERQTALIQVFTEMGQYEPESENGKSRKFGWEFPRDFRRMLFELQHAECEQALLHHVTRYMECYFLESEEIVWLSNALEENVVRLRHTSHFEADDSPVLNARDHLDSEHDVMEQFRLEQEAMEAYAETTGAFDTVPFSTPWSASSILDSPAWNLPTYGDAMDEDDMAIRYTLHISMQDARDESHSVQMNGPLSMSDMDVHDSYNATHWGI